jgi:hypothetical protein
MYRTALGAPCKAKPGSPVERHVVPHWFQVRLAKDLGDDDHSGDGYSLFSAWARRRCDSTIWFDHWGTTFLNGQFVPVSEPYLRLEDDFTEVRAAAEMLDCNLVIGEKSHWYPGKTIRLAFLPKGGRYALWQINVSELKEQR